MIPHVDERIRHIARMMARGEWRTRESKAALASEWEVSESAVKYYATQASRLLRADALDDDIDEVREATIGRLESLSQQAEDRGQFKTAVQAEIEKAKVAGVVTSGQTVNVLVDASGQPKGALADMAAVLVAFAAARPEVAGDLASAIRGAGGALKPATATIAAQLEQHAVVESYPEWLLETQGEARDALELLWLTMPGHSAETSRDEVQEWAGELVRRVG